MGCLVACGCDARRLVRTVGSFIYFCHGGCIVGYWLVFVIKWLTHFNSVCEDAHFFFRLASRNCLYNLTASKAELWKSHCVRNAYCINSVGGFLCQGWLIGAGKEFVTNIFLPSYEAFCQGNHWSKMISLQPLTLSQSPFKLGKI